MGSFTIADLPVELRAQCFAHLGWSDIEQCAAVCKSFCEGVRFYEASTQCQVKRVVHEWHVLLDTTLPKELEVFSEIALSADTEPLALLTAIKKKLDDQVKSITVFDDVSSYIDKYNSEESLRSFLLNEREHMLSSLLVLLERLQNDALLTHLASNPANLSLQRVSVELVNRMTAIVTSLE